MKIWFRNASLYIQIVQEMRDVCELPENIISEHIEKITFYYGLDDPWTLKSCYEDMVQRFPDKDVNLCRNGFSHAFVITESKELADFAFTRLFLERSNHSK